MCLATATLSGQVNANAQAPVVVSNTSVERSAGGFKVSYAVTNWSLKTVVAYVTVVSFFDANGNVASRTTRTRMMGFDPSGKKLLPGETNGEHTRHVHLRPDGTPLGTKVSVDYVLFEDGSSWGPDTTKRSVEVQATLRGWELARAHFKRLLKEKGVQSVIEDLNRY